MSIIKSDDDLKYSLDDFASIIRGYKKIDHQGKFTSILKDVSLCQKCNEAYREKRDDLPVNCLVRPLPLDRLNEEKEIEKYFIRVRRDHGFLKNLFDRTLKTKTVVNRLVSTKFSIGLNPWLDRCMLHRKFRKTKLMIVGIDYKHLPAFQQNDNDHSFPLDSYKKRSNIWGPTWRRFWQNVLNQEYNDSTIDRFIRNSGVFMTNSMLCFGGSEDPQSHFYGYLESCRDHVSEMIRIVRPEVLVSFGNFGCRNAASILLGENDENEAIQKLANSRSPLRQMASITRKGKFKNGIEAKYNFHNLIFWPLYQPARSHVYKYRGDYTKLRHLLDLG